MYNEEVKAKFISEKYKSVSSVKGAIYFFEATQPYEYEWGKDLYDASKEQLNKLSLEVSGSGKLSSSRIIMLKSYLRWCINNNISTNTVNPDEIAVTLREKIKSRSISGPLALSIYLDNIFPSTLKHTINNTYRAFIWMIFSGIKDANAIEVTESNVDFMNSCIRINDIEYPIYRESIDTLKSCCEMKCFEYRTSEKKKPYWRDRYDSEFILRGYRNEKPKLNQLKNEISIKILKPHADNNDFRLTLVSIRDAGIFYRMYEKERAGIIVDFMSDALILSKERGSLDINSVKRTCRRLEKDYIEWKSAFNNL